MPTARHTRGRRHSCSASSAARRRWTGGFSTFLGVLPHSFGVSEVFRTLFVTFLGIVFLGAGHGLIFTPVVLSLIAPHTPPVEQADEAEEGVSGALAALSLLEDMGKNQLFDKGLDLSNATTMESNFRVTFSRNNISFADVVENVALAQGA